MLRLFAALPMPDHICDVVAQAQRGLDGAKWSPRENMHVTLRFIGDVDEPKAEDIDAELGEISLAGFEMALAGAGFFGNDEPHAMWLGLAPNPHLLTLQKACERACRRAGLEASARAYTPHATVCYLPRHQALEPVMAYQQRHALFSSPTWIADRFYLYSSRTNGPGPSRFTIEAEYPLMG
jgi:RNA 2',3'-cyclic 3'-phosphodiesterase